MIIFTNVLSSELKLFVFPQEVYKFLDDEKRILEEEKKGLEQDKKDLELALNTAQDELKAISENMAVEEENFDKQRLINVLEGDFPHCLFIRSSLFFVRDGISFRRGL